MISAEMEKYLIKIKLFEVQYSSFMFNRQVSSNNIIIAKLKLFNVNYYFFIKSCIKMPIV